MFRYYCFAGLVVALVLVACGDPRAPFLGNYAGTLTQTVTLDGGTQSSSSATVWGITTEDGTDRLLFGGSCGMVADVSGQGFSILPKTCPPVASSTCQMTQTIQAGSGSVVGASLTFNHVGAAAIACTGSAPQTGSYSQSFTGTRQ